MRKVFFCWLWEAGPVRTQSKPVITPIKEERFMGICPECHAVIRDDNYDIGEVIECPECGVELEVVGVDPLDLEVFEEEEK